MYSYIYDDFLQDRRHERDLTLLETRLTDLGIMGKITRLALFRDSLEVIKDEIEAGVGTVVAVGNDRTLRKVIEAAKVTRAVIGYIPLGQKNILADLLGIPSGVAACDILSARLVQDIDLGEINSRRFLHTAQTEGSGLVISCDDSYTMTVPGRVSLEIRNLAFPDETGKTNPTDGKLTLILKHTKFSFFRRKSEYSKIHIKKARLYAERHLRMFIDGEELQAKEFDIRAIPGRLRLITGKGRQF